MILDPAAQPLLRDGGEAARFLAAEPGRLAAVSNAAEPAFQEEAARLGLALRARGTVDGFNYSRGRRMAVVLYGAE